MVKLKILKPAYILVLIGLLIIIFNIVISFWFNNKLNRITNEVKIAISSNNNEKVKIITKKVNYGKLLKYQENYNSTKQYFDYSTSQIQSIENAKIDENGIALKSQDDKYVYNPVIIAQYGLNQYGNYIETNENKYYDKAKLQADYLLEVQDKQNGKFYYNYDFFVAGTNETMKAPWSSGMAQGQVISLLTRIYSISKDEKYIEAAKLAMKPLTQTVKEGGLCADFFGYDYYEEYPTEVPSYTLNGFMFTIIGLHDLYDVTKDPEAKRLYDKGIETLEFCLPFHDSNGISLYHLGHLFGHNLPLHYAEHYHRLHIIQLKTINQFENNDVFEYYINRWENYVKENS